MTITTVELLARLNQGVFVIMEQPGAAPMYDYVSANQAMREAATLISNLVKALEPFAKAFEDAAPYKDFDGRDCRENCVINAVSLSDFELAYTALRSNLDKEEGDNG